jgi:ribosomal protein L11 methyltransferase
VTHYVATTSLPDRESARTVSAAIEHLLDTPPDALTLFEVKASDGGGWRIDAYFADEIDGAALAETVGGLTEQVVPAFSVTTVPELNWVAISQASLPPVACGRFVVHGSHDAARVPQGPNAILIDAGEAFGTAHHQTTAGCLAAIDRITRRRTYADVLDLGCGSGVLAIALARTLPRARIIASDMDAVSVDVARDNARLNGVAGRITALTATGLDHPRIRRAAPFDLLVANILAGPLIDLAPHIAEAVARGGTLLLSGLLIHQAREVTNVYRAHGFRLDRHDRVDGWSTLTMTRVG